MATGEKFSETEMDDMSKKVGDDVGKAKEDAAEAKEKIDGTTSKEEQERILDELQEKQRQSYFDIMDTFLSDKIFGGGKRSTKIVKLRENLILTRHFIQKLKEIILKEWFLKKLNV